MRSRCLNTNIAKANLHASHIEGERDKNGHRCSGCSVMLYIIDLESTVLSAWLIPPHNLTIDKYYISQNSVAFKGVLSLSCLRAFRLARNIPSRAICIAFDFSQCVLFRLLSTIEYR